MGRSLQSKTDGAVMIKKQYGFTIVELLIVIVVIGILAAIVIVAFNGVQNRAVETSVKSDLNNFAKKVSLFQADKGYFPASATDLNNDIRMPFGRANYNQVDGNMMYCASASGANYMIIIQSTKLNRYYQGSNTGGVKDYTGPSGSPATMCDSTGFVTSFGTWGYEPAGWGNPGWRPWTAA